MIFKILRLTIAINFISAKDVEGERIMHSRSDDIKFTSYNDANEVVAELFQSFQSRFQGYLETLMRRNDFVFDSVQLMYYKCHKVNFRRVGSCIDSPE